MVLTNGINVMDAYGGKYQNHSVETTSWKRWELLKAISLTEHIEQSKETKLNISNAKILNHPLWKCLLPNSLGKELILEDKDC